MKQSEISRHKEVVILGETLSSEYFPKLYVWALENPETLESQIKSIAEKWHQGSIISAILALESDLSYQ